MDVTQKEEEKTTHQIAATAISRITPRRTVGSKANRDAKYAIDLVTSPKTAEVRTLIKQDRLEKIKQLRRHMEHSMYVTQPLTRSMETGY